MATCPFCAEDIQDAAIKCKHCGSLLSQSHMPQPTAPLWLTLGSVGTLLLVLGVFTPLVNLPVLGSLSYWARGDGDSWVVLALAAGAMAGLATRAPGLAALCGILMGPTLAYTYTCIKLRLDTPAHKLSQMLSEKLPAALDATSLQPTGLSWAWLPLLVGTALIIGAGLAGLREQATAASEAPPAATTAGEA